MMKIAFLHSAVGKMAKYLLRIKKHEFLAPKISKIMKFSAQFFLNQEILDAILLQKQGILTRNLKNLEFLARKCEKWTFFGANFLENCIFYAPICCHFSHCATRIRHTTNVL